MQDQGEQDHKVKMGLHKKQISAYMSPATEILYGGAAGGGKSHVMRVSAISWCMEIDNLAVYIFRKVLDRKS
ncbi:MAG: hypothetical protein AB8B85_05445, partial [Paracoccaceae bacterium]